MKTQTVPSAIEALAQAIGRAQVEIARDRLNQWANIRVPMPTTNGAVPAATTMTFNADPRVHRLTTTKRPYRRSKSGRARQIAAMKKYWAAKRKAAKGKK